VLSVAVTTRLEVRHLGLWETIEMGRQAQHRRSGTVNYQGHHAAPQQDLDENIVFISVRLCLRQTWRQWGYSTRFWSAVHSGQIYILFPVHISRRIVVAATVQEQGEKRPCLLEAGGMLMHSLLWQHIRAEENCV